MIKESLFVESLFTQFKIHHQIAERAIDVPAVALDRRVAGSVDQIDGDGVGVDDVVGGEEGSNLLMAGNHRILAHVGTIKERRTVVDISGTMRYVVTHKLYLCVFIRLNPWM